MGTEAQIHLLDLKTGQVRWQLEHLEPIGLCADVLLTREPGPNTYKVHAYNLEGRPLWQVCAARQTPTRYCTGGDGFYAWPNFQAPKGTRLSVDFHPIGEPDHHCELEGTPNYLVERLHEHAGWLACYRWGDGPSQCVVYHDRQPIWSLDHLGSNTPEIWADPAGWVMSTYEASVGWSSQGERLWAAPGLRRRWVSKGCLLGEQEEGVVAIDRSTGLIRPLIPGRLRDLTLAEDQVWWLNWQSLGCESWTHPLATLGIWAHTDADRLVAYAGQLFLSGSDGSLACFSPQGA